MSEFNENSSTGTNEGMTVSKELQRPNYDITGVKIQKLGMFMPYFNEHTEEFIFKCSGRGDNSWKRVATKIHELDTASEEDANYHTRIYEEFDVNNEYSVIDIIKSISKIRRDMKLAIGEQVPKWYLDQICNLFLTEKVHDETAKYPKVTGYRLLFKLDPKAHH